VTTLTASADSTVFAVATTAAAGCCCIGSIDKTEKPEKTKKEKVILGQSVDPEKSDVWKIGNLMLELQRKSQGDFTHYT